MSNTVMVLMVMALTGPSITNIGAPALVDVVDVGCGEGVATDGVFSAVAAAEV